MRREHERGNNLFSNWSLGRLKSKTIPNELLTKVLTDLPTELLSELLAELVTELLSELLTNYGLN